MTDNDTKNSIISEEKTDTNDSVALDLYKDFPSFSNTFLKKLQETFDIRRMCRYVDNVHYLQGVQDVLNFLENCKRYKEE